MIFDGITFAGEFECLKLRCEELKVLNPTHVIVESEWTHSGKRKPLHFAKRRHEFKDYDIISLVFCPDHLIGWTRNPWIIERAQRDSMTNIVYRPNDVWMISDADEIPKADAIMGWSGDTCAALEMKSHRYFLNRRPHESPCVSAKIVRGSYLTDHSATAIRHAGCEELIKDAGWHFSWMGGLERIQQKLTSFAHTEMNTEELRAEQKWLEDFAAQPYDEINSTYPLYLRNNQSEFRNLIHEVTTTKPQPERKDIGPA